MPLRENIFEAVKFYDNNPHFMPRHLDDQLLAFMILFHCRRGMLFSFLMLIILGNEVTLGLLHTALKIAEEALEKYTAQYSILV